MRTLGSIAVVFLLLLVTTAFAREWSPSDDEIPGIPLASSATIETIRDANQTLHIRFSKPQVKFETVSLFNRNWTFVSIDGETRRWEVGKPLVPVVARPVLLPNHGNVEVKIVRSKYTEYPNLDLLPQQLSPELGKAGYIVPPFRMDTLTYQQDRWLPDQLSEISKPVILRDARTALLNIQPVSYNPARHTVRVYTEIEIEIIPIGGQGINELNQTVAHSAPGFAQFYQDILGADELYTANANALPGSMLVICRADSQVINTIKPYLAWRNRAGRPTQLVTTSLSSITPAIVQNIITTAYNSYSPPLEMVLLVGDGGETGSYTLPARIFSSVDDNIQTDHYYTEIVGNDILADVFLSRWSCDNAQQLATQVYRSIYYERNPAMGTSGADTTWFKRGWGYACRIIDSNRSAVLYSLAMMNAAGVPQSGLYYDEQDYPVDQSLINTRCNDGLLFWAHRLAYVGQMYPNHVSGVTRNVNKCFVGLNITCGSGAWYTPGVQGIQEQLTRNGTPSAPAGAIAAVATETSSTHSAPNICMLTGTYYGLGVKKATTPAAMYYEGKFQLWRNYWNTESSDMAMNFSYWNNIMGDVSVKIWTGVPHRVTASIPTQIGLGQNNLPLTFLDQYTRQPISGALVTVMKQNSGNQFETYSRGLTDESGQVDLPLTNTTTGNLFVTVIGNRQEQNLLPLLDTIAVVQLQPEVALSGYTIIDDTLNGRSGNSDSLASPDETIDLAIRIRNLGSTDSIFGISSTLSSLHPLVALIGNQSTYPNLPPSGSADNLQLFRLQLLPGLKNTETIPLRLTITTRDTSLNRNLMIALPIVAPSLQFVEYNLTSAPFLPGNSSDLSVSISNLGAIGTSASTATLLSLSPYVSVNTNSVQFPAISCSQTVSNPSGSRFRITSNIHTPIGSIIPFALVFHSVMLQDTVYFSIPVGTINTTDPVGPDAYGYLAYDDTDLGYPAHPVFNWINNETTQNRLNMYDMGEGQDISVLVRLPFRAKYYGAYFDTITVCSNGWMSFGPARVTAYTGIPATLQTQLLHNWRPWHLPSQESASNMVAVDWQDLMMNSLQQGVYASYDTSNGWFVITWDGSSVNGNLLNVAQLIIYDPARWYTSTGDSKLQIQLKTFNCPSSSGPEPGYATIGICDSTLTRAIEYYHWNRAATGAAPILMGANINRTILFSPAQRLQTGSISGFIRSTGNNLPVPNTTISIQTAGNSTSTDSSGHYAIDDVVAGQYPVRISALGYNLVTDTIVIGDQIHLERNYLLSPSQLQVSLHPQDTVIFPTDTLIALLSDSISTTTRSIYLRNVGNQSINWNTELDFERATEDEIDYYGDRVLQWNASQAVGGDQALFGVEFDGNHFWITGANNYSHPHKLYKLNRSGQLIASYNCPDQTGLFGWRDLAWDGHYLYASYSSYIDRIDTANGEVLQRYLTTLNPARAIAIDTATHTMYYCDQRSSIYQMDLVTGTVIGTLPNPFGLSGINGLAWYPNDTDNKFLFAFCRDQSSYSRGARIYKIDPSTGLSTPQTFPGYTSENAAGIAITPLWDSYSWSAVALIENPVGDDRLELYQLDPYAQWLRLSPRQATISSSSRDSLIVTFDASNIPAGIHRASISIAFNSNLNAVSIPVVMQIVRANSVETSSQLLPETIELRQNYPNPFNAMTSIAFSLPRSSSVNLTIYDALGREVTQLIKNTQLSTGYHQISFNANKLSAGIYFYQLAVGQNRSTRKMLLLK